MKGKVGIQQTRKKTTTLFFSSLGLTPLEFTYQQFAQMWGTCFCWINEQTYSPMK